jgi:hypothetical protein
MKPRVVPLGLLLALTGGVLLPYRGHRCPSDGGGLHDDDLTPGTRNFSTAQAINTAGDIVGTANGSRFLLHDGKMTNLGAVGPTAINDLGEIAGGTQGRAFLLTPS